MRRRATQILHILDLVGLRARALRSLAAQLGHPRGLSGRLVGRVLNRGNRAMIAAAVDALEVQSEAVTADLGFGGGAGLDLLLARLGPGGRVHGADVSTEMLAGARRRLGGEVATGRLVLHEAGLEALPLPDDALDAAMTLNTLYFVSDLPAALGEMARVVRPGGRLVLGLGDPTAMGRLPFTAHGFHLRPIEAVVTAAASAGLALEEHRLIGAGDDAYHLLLTTPL